MARSISPKVAGVGRFVSVYVVMLDEVHEAVGGDRDDIRMAVEDYDCAIEYAEDAAYFANHPAGDRIPSMPEALRAVIAGGPYREGFDYRYNKAYRDICQTCSEGNASHGPYRGDWLSEVDRGLRSVGIDAISFTAFEGDTPRGLPPIEDGGYGEWTHDECVRALAEWDAASQRRLSALDRHVREWVAVGVDFAAMAAAKPGFGIAGFFTI